MKKTNKAKTKRTIRWKRDTITVLDRPSARSAQREIERIRKTHGKATAENLIKESKDENAILHGVFEWNNKIASHKYRLGQARELINSLEVLVIEQDPKGKPKREIPIPAYLSVKDEDGSRDYQPTEIVMDDNELRERALTKAWNELLSWQQRYKHLREFASIRRAITEGAKAADRAA